MDGEINAYIFHILSMARTDGLPYRDANEVFQSEVEVWRRLIAKIFFFSDFAAICKKDF